MRLIDFDKLMEQYDFYNEFAVHDLRYLKKECLPFVEAIPIDKPFLKMRYGDYVVYNKKWLVDHLQTEWNILQGKEYQPAIPVEWMKKWHEEEDRRLGDGWTHVEHPHSFSRMVADWEKENEHKESD